MSLPRWVSVSLSRKVGRAIIISSSQVCCKALRSKGSLSSSTDRMGSWLEMQVLRPRLTYLLNQNVHVNKTLIIRLVCTQQFIRIKLDNICIVSDTTRNTVKDRIVVISDAPSPSVQTQLRHELSWLFSEAGVVLVLKSVRKYLICSMKKYLLTCEYMELHNSY